MSPMRFRGSVAVIVVCLVSHCISCGNNQYVRIARVEGDTRRYALQELNTFPPSARKVHPSKACNALPGDSGMEDFWTRLLYPKSRDAIILQTSCTDAEYRDKSLDRCYQFAMNAARPVPIPCGAREDYESAGSDSTVEAKVAGWTRRYYLQLPEAQLALEVGDDAVAGNNWIMGGGVKGPYTSKLEVFDTRLSKRIFSLTTTKGLWDLQPAWFAVGKRAKIVVLLSVTHTVVIDIHPAPGE